MLGNTEEFKGKKFDTLARYKLLSKIVADKWHSPGENYIKINTDAVFFFFLYGQMLFCLLIWSPAVWGGGSRFKWQVFGGVAVSLVTASCPRSC